MSKGLRNPTTIKCIPRQFIPDFNPKLYRKHVQRKHKDVDSTTTNFAKHNEAIPQQVVDINEKSSDSGYSSKDTSLRRGTKRKIGEISRTSTATQSSLSYPTPNVPEVCPLETPQNGKKPKIDIVHNQSTMHEMEIEKRSSDGQSEPGSFKENKVQQQMEFKLQCPDEICNHQTQRMDHMR